MDEEQASQAARSASCAQLGIVITDARAEDNPITFVNDGFQRITLYSREFAIGRNCRFLQGERTEREAVEDIRRKLGTGEEFQVEITNHKADGTAFRNQLLISPITDDAGEVTTHFGVQRLIDDDTGQDRQSLDLLRELQHRVKNHLSMVVSMIRIQATRKVTPESLRAVGRRVEALSLLYEELFATSSTSQAGETIHTGAYLSRIASAIAGLEGRSAIRVNVDCEEIDLPVDKAARLGLLLSELLTNALEHAFEGRESGFIRVRFEKLTGGGVRLSVEDDGVGLPEDSNWPYESMSVEGQRERAEHEDGELDTTGDKSHSGVGGSIIVALTKTLGATLDVNRALRGTIVTVDFEAT
ncbi:PAS domain-containing protein [Wenxinia marina]|uniref:histidine kinase n=1 Tax=Wenxinia marina DSM 24838 TaxID=1123501 RepID=A0A0D0NJ86_9RHOB|nr:PAS domain-containing protein [Wenxinia marina]KIQ68410.1 PAS domain S-box [Wenxinia marina DSM 24838]GGL72440.1 signal transduction histidine kinase [Wenxinia marina]